MKYVFNYRCKDGVVRTLWQTVRERVKAVNPTFAELVNELSPDASFPVYLFYFRYGELTVDTLCPFVPGCDGVTYRLSSPDLPKEILDELGYGVASCPLGMVLEKNIEYYIDIPSLQLTLPRFIRYPGSMFPISRIFQRDHGRNYNPTGILSAISGCRSVFMLPHIGAKNHYERLQYDFNLTSPRPEKLYQHFNIFKELTVSKEINSTWRSCILYFSEKWLQHILEDPAWSKVRVYLLKLAIEHFEPEYSKGLLDSVFSYIQVEKNLKPNPYIAETAKHILNCAIGTALGYAPANNDDFLPVSSIEGPFIESYGMKKYFPTIMQPKRFLFEEESHPIYYSLQYPSTLNFSPKSRTTSSVLVEMRELATLLEIFTKELSKENSPCSDSVFARIRNEVTIECLHNQSDRKSIIQESGLIEKIDSRFNRNFFNETVPGQKFSSDGKFFRGCVSIYGKSLLNKITNQ